MTLTELKKYLKALNGAVTFDYNGYSCGIDPLSANEFDMWYGDKSITLDSLDDVFNHNFFDGNSLFEIWDDISEIDF